MQSCTKCFQSLPADYFTKESPECFLCYALHKVCVFEALICPDCDEKKLAADFYEGSPEKGYRFKACKTCRMIQNCVLCKYPCSTYYFRKGDPVCKKCRGIVHEIDLFKSDYDNMQCAECCQYKKADEFHKSSACTRGRRPSCKKCEQDN